MCLLTCEWCNDWLTSAPCYYHINPILFKKEHPKLFARYAKNEKEAKEKHRCKVRNLKKSVAYWKSLWKKTQDNATASKQKEND